MTNLGSILGLKLRLRFDITGCSLKTNKNQNKKKNKKKMMWYPLVLLLGDHKEFIAL